MSANGMERDMSRAPQIVARSCTSAVCVSDGGIDVELLPDSLKRIFQDGESGYVGVADAYRRKTPARMRSKASNASAIRGNIPPNITCSSSSSATGTGTTVRNCNF